MYFSEVMEETIVDSEPTIEKLALLSMLLDRGFDPEAPAGTATTNAAGVGRPNTKVD